MLYLFDQDDKFISILTVETGLVDMWFKDYQNHLIDEPFVFKISSESPKLKYIEADNQVAFTDRDGNLRLMRMKQLYEESSQEESLIRVICEPSYLELYDHFIEDKRFVDKTAQDALNGALQGSRYIGEVTVELGLATDNFYWIDGIGAVFKILETWGGALKDTITLNADNEIIERKIWIVQRLGADNGLIVEPDFNAESIERKTLSYVKTALWGQGSSLEITDEDDEHTGGYTRFITFEDVEWKVSAGDPVDKPKGQKWVGDPQALSEHGDLHNGIRKHRFGHFSNQDYETPEELLMATWLELQERKLKEVIHEASIIAGEKIVSLGDTVTILNRNYNKPIELQSQITGLEYDPLRPKEDVTIVIGKYIDMNEDALKKEVDDLKEAFRNPRPTAPITDSSFPDIKPGTPTNVTTVGVFRAIKIEWDYDSAVYISHYEVYGSQIKDFVPDSQHLLYRGRVSAFGHEVGSNEMWYYRVRAVNKRGTAGEYSVEVSASSTRIDFIDMKDEIKAEIDGAKNRADEAVANANLATQNATEAITQAQGAFDKAQDAIGKSDEAFDKSVEAFDKSQTAFDKADEAFKDVTALSTKVDVHTNEISTIKQTAQGLQTQVSNNKNDITTVSQLATGLQTQVTNNKGDITTLTQQATGLQTQVSNNKNDITTVTQLANGLQTKVSNAEGNISTLQQTADTFSTRIGKIEDWEIGGRNLLSDTSNQPRALNNTGYNFYIFEVVESKVKEIIENKGFYTASVMIDETTYAESMGVMVSFRNKNTGLKTQPLSTQRATTGFSGKLIFTFEVPDINYDEGDYIEVHLRNALNTYSFRGVVREIKLEKGNKATGWSPAPEDTTEALSAINQTIDSISTRVQSNDGKIATLTQTAQGLQTQVSDKADKSTVTQLAGVVDSKISTNDANAKFATQSQLTQTSSSLQSTITSVRADLNGLEIGGRNLYIESREVVGALTSTGDVNSADGYRTSDFIKVDSGIDYMISNSDVPDSNRLAYFDANKAFVRRDLLSGKVREVTIPGGVEYVKLTKMRDLLIQIEKGNKATDWSPAPEDMATQSQISQLSNAINLRVKENDVINQINIDTSGILISGKKLILDGDVTVMGTFRVNNANIASIDAGKMTTGTLDAANVTLINLRGLDIYGSKFRSSNGNDSMEIIGGNVHLEQSNGRYVNVNPSGLYGYNAGGEVRFQADQSLVTSAALGTSNDNIYLASNNEARVVNYSSIPGDGNVNSYSYLPIRSLVYRFPDIPNGYFTLLNGGEFRFTGESITNPVYQNLRANGYYGNFVETRTTVDMLYLRAKSRVRTTALGTTDTYIDFQTNNIQATSIRTNAETPSTHFYIGTGQGELRITSNSFWGGSHETTIYRDVRASGYYGNTFDQHSGVGGSHIYIRPISGGELRVTRTGTTGTYQGIRASAFNESSSRDFKTNIQTYEESALDVINNLTVVTYNLKDDLENGVTDPKIGFISEDSEAIATLDRKAIQTYKISAYNTKAIQELNKKVEIQQQIIEGLQLKIAKMESAA